YSRASACQAVSRGARDVAAALPGQGFSLMFQYVTRSGPCGRHNPGYLPAGLACTARIWRTGLPLDMDLRHLEECVPVGAAQEAAARVDRPGRGRIQRRDREPRGARAGRFSDREREPSLGSVAGTIPPGRDVVLYG